MATRVSALQVLAAAIPLIVPSSRGRASRTHRPVVDGAGRGRIDVTAQHVIVNRMTDHDLRAYAPFRIADDDIRVNLCGAWLPVHRVICRSVNKHVDRSALARIAGTRLADGGVTWRQNRSLPSGSHGRRRRSVGDLVYGRGTPMSMKFEETGERATRQATRPESCSAPRRCCCSPRSATAEEPVIAADMAFSGTEAAGVGEVAAGQRRVRVAGCTDRKNSYRQFQPCRHWMRNR